MTQDEETSDLRTLPPDALRARLQAGARAQRGQAVSIIHFWRGVTLVQRRRLWEAWEFKSFHDYCSEDLDLRTRRYIRERMAIGDLSVSRYEGCALGVDVLVRLVDLELVEQDAVAAASRQHPELTQTDALRALGALKQVKDRKQRPALLKSWLLGEAPIPVVHKGRNKRPKAEVEPPGPETRWANDVAQVMVGNLEQWPVLVPELLERLRCGDELCEGLRSRMRALLPQHPQALQVLYGLLGLEAAPAPVTPPAGERRGQERAKGGGEGNGGEGEGGAGGEGDAGGEGGGGGAKSSPPDGKSEESAEVVNTEGSAEVVKTEESAEVAKTEGTTEVVKTETAQPDPPPPPPPPPPDSLASARRPDLWRRGDVALPVPYPTYVQPGGPQPSLLDRMACGIIALATTAQRAVAEFNDLRGRRLHEADPVLALHLSQISNEAGDYMEAVSSLFGDRAEEGARVLTPAYRAAAAALAKDPPQVTTPYAQQQLQRRLAAAAPDGPVPAYYDEYEGWEPLFPVRPHPAWAPGAFAALPEPGVPVFDWCVLATGDYLGLDAPSPLHPLMFRYIGAMKALEPALVTLIQASTEHGADTLDPRLALQLQSITEDLQGSSLSARTLVEAEATVGVQVAAARAASRASRSADADARLIVLGDRQRPRQFFRIGKDQYGRDLAITADTAQITAIMGATGYGKTHMERVIAEGVSFHMPGLNCLDGPQRVILSEIDYSRGRTRRQMLSQFFANPDPQQLHQLERDYGYRADGDEHFHDGTLLCFPEAVDRLKVELARFCERGLVIRPIELGLGDLNAVAYRAFLLHASGASDGGRAAYWGTVEALIAECGDHLRPAELAEQLRKTTLRCDVKDPLIRMLKLLDKLVKPEARLNDVLLQPRPVFTLLESSVYSPELLLPTLHIVENALRRPLRDGTSPRRWMINDEHHKRAGNAVVDGGNRESTQERRHGLDSLVIDCQRPSGLDRPFLAGATIVMVFRLLSRKEIRVVKDCYAMLESIPDEVFLNLRPGQCVVAAMESTGSDEVYIVNVRPTASYAGGETLRG